MKKIKEFLSNNKEEMRVLVYGTGMLLAGLYFGVRIERRGMDNMCVRMANTGKTAYKIIDNEMYQMEIIKGIPK